jgi:hypothetical protein
MIERDQGIEINDLARRAGAAAPVALPNSPLAPVPAAPQAPQTDPLPTSPLLHIQRDDRESDRRRDGNRQKLTHSELDFAHSIIGRVLLFQWLMWLSEAHADISVHLMILLANHLRQIGAEQAGKSLPA